MKLHPNQISMLKRHGWRLEDDLATGELRAQLDGLSAPIQFALRECRKLNRRTVSQKFRSAHKDRVNAYARKWREANREAARAIVNKSARKQRAASTPIHHS